jgi:outer membrane receptor protein involved in Fe transport
MNRTRGLAVGVLFAVFIAAASSTAQTALGTLRGTVLDDQGGALPGATVTVRQIETNTVTTSTSGEQGTWFLPNLRPGSYEVTFELAGFASQKQSLTLSVGQDLTVNASLHIAGLTEATEVVAKSLAVDTQSTLATVVSKKQLDDLPTVGRNFGDLATLAPGVTTSTATGAGQGTGISVSGQRPFTNGIVVDGASNTMQFYGRQANDFPQDWIQEFQVLTTSFTAEFGQAAGGMLNVITRSGANRTSGRGYGFFRDAALDSPPFAGRYTADQQPIFLDKTPAFDQQRFGGFLGGALIKDRVFYFGGLERVRLNSSDVLGISDYWRRSITDTIIPTGQRSTVGIIKVDVNANNNNRGYFRYTNTHRRDLNVAGTTPGAAGPLNTLENRQEFGGPLWNALGNWTTTLSSRAFNEARITYSVNKPWILSNAAGGLGGSALLDAAGYNLVNGNPTGTFAAITYPGASFGATGFTGLEGEGSLSLVDNFSMLVGRHQFKIGAQINRSRMFMDVEAAHKGRWTFTQDLAFDINNPASYPSSFTGNIGTGQANPSAWNPSFYIQDTWQMSKSLTLNLGIRYDLDNTTTTVNDYVGPYNDRIVARLGGTAPIQESEADRNNFAPRLGFVWVPANDRRTTIRGSFGLYYDQNHWNFTDIYLNETLLSLQRINLNANTQANNPFWTPANTAIGIAQMRAFLASNFPGYPDPKGLPFPQETILGVSPTYRIPYSVSSSIGATHDLPHGISLRADYVHTTTQDPSIAPDTNWNQNADGTFTRRDTRYGNITLVKNGGFIKYDGLVTRVELQPSASMRAGLSYTLSKTTSNMTTGLSTGGVTNPFDLNEDRGPDDNDRRHNAVVDASYLLPKIGVQVAGLASYRSALPYSVSTSFQLDTDPFADRPEPRNSRRGDKESTLDLRVSKIFHFGRYTATGFWEMFNVANADNWLRYQGSLQSTTFGLPLTEAAKRRQQLGFRFEF